MFLLKTKHVKHDNLNNFGNTNKKKKHESFKAPSHHCIVLQTYDACNGTKITTSLLIKGLRFQVFDFKRQKSCLVNKENR